MLIKVTYNKTSGDIQLTADNQEITVEVNSNEISDTVDTLYFEIAVDTTAYELTQSNPVQEEIIE